MGYDFRLYTYGPFDSDVLDDLETAQSFQALHVKTVLFPFGYGYEVKAGPRLRPSRNALPIGWRPTRSDLAWAVENFAARSASELELLATIVYVDREFAGQRGPRQLLDLVQRVRVVKPRFVRPMCWRSAARRSKWNYCPPSREGCAARRSLIHRFLPLDAAQSSSGPVYQFSTRRTIVS